MKRIGILFLVLFTMVFFVSCGQGEDKKQKESEEKPLETAVTVNGTQYTIERFNLYFYNAQDEILKQSGYNEAKDIPEDFWDIERNGVTRLDLARDVAIDMLVDDALEYEKARQYKIKLTADELSSINNQLSALRQDKVSVAQFEYMGISVDELESYYKDEMLIPSLVTELINEGSIKPSPESVVDEFVTSYVKVKQLYLPTIDSVTGKPYSQDDMKYVKAKANEFLDRLDSGELFDDIVLEYTEDFYATAYPDGYIIGHGDWDEAMEEIVFSLEDEEVTELITTPDGMYMIKRVPFDFEGSQEIVCLESIEAEFAQPKLEALVKKWRQKADIEINNEILKDLKPHITNNQAITVKIK